MHRLAASGHGNPGNARGRGWHSQSAASHSAVTRARESLLCFLFILYLIASSMEHPGVLWSAYSFRSTRTSIDSWGPVGVARLLVQFMERASRPEVCMYDAALLCISGPANAGAISRTKIYRMVGLFYFLFFIQTIYRLLAGTTKRAILDVAIDSQARGNGTPVRLAPETCIAGAQLPRFCTRE